MKVTLAKEYRKFYTLNELDIAKEIISCAKEDGATAKEYAEIAVREALRGKDDYIEEILKATAETAKNCKVWDRYFDGSESMDIYINATAETSKGFIKIGTYLSDIWVIDGAANIQERMYIKYYTEDK